MFFLIRLCREPQRGWLKTIRFVIHPIGHGMVPIIFWVCISGADRGRVLGIAHKAQRP